MINIDKNKQRALTRIKVYFNNGTSEYFYSLDDSIHIKSYNPIPGIKKLEKNILKKHLGQWNFAILYGVNYQPRQQIRKYNPYDIAV